MEIKESQEIYNEANINFDIVEPNKDWVLIDDIIKWINEELDFVYKEHNMRAFRALELLKKILLSPSAIPNRPKLEKNV